MEILEVVDQALIALDAQRYTIERQRTLLEQRGNIIERLFTLVDSQKKMIDNQVANSQRLTDTIKWLHKQIQEMDAESAGLIPPRR